MSARSEARRFPAGGRRLVVYTLYDRRGAVEDYVLHALTGIAAHSDRVVVVVNGSCEPRARAEIEARGAEVIVRENSGLDIGAQRQALTMLGKELEQYDEVLLTNDTWYGPIGSFDALFERMDERELDFWGMTAHQPATPHPLTGEGSAPYHLQSYWLAVRRRMLASAQWGAYWSDMPPISDYRDAVLVHESRFTDHFRSLGFVGEAAFDADRYATDNASLWMPEQLLDDGCPVLKRRVLFHSPLELDRHAVVGRWVIERAVERGMPAGPLWRDLARNVQPKVLSTNAGLLRILDADVHDHPERADPSDDVPRIVVIVHIFYVEMTDELLDRADHLPGGYDLVVTTPTAEKARDIERIVRRRRDRSRRSDVRVVASNDGRDQSAFLIGARDVLRADDYDLVVKLHSKKTPQDGFNVGRHFAAHQFDNLLASDAYARNVVALFAEEPWLGVVFPPMIHVGYPTLGQGWWANRPGVAQLCRRLGVSVPLDESSPLAPYGSMFVARPDALRVLTDVDWTYADFGGADQYRDGGLAHVLERMPAYAAGERGYTSRTILTSGYASISTPLLDFDLDQLTALVPAPADEQFRRLTRVGHFGDGRASDFARVYLRDRLPGLGSALRRWAGPLRGVLRRDRGAR